MDRLQKFVNESRLRINYLTSKATPPTRLGIHLCFISFFRVCSANKLIRLLPKGCNASNMKCWKFNDTSSHLPGSVSLPPTERNCPLPCYHGKFQDLFPPLPTVLYSAQCQTARTHRGQRLPQFLQCGAKESFCVLANSAFHESLPHDFQQIMSPSKVMVISFLFWLSEQQGLEGWCA